MSEINGPWEAVGGLVRTRYDGHGGFLVADCHNTSFTEEECHAHANLIAAAPDLLAACQLLADFAERQGWLHVAINDARAALAKAKGHSL